ncbi:DUF982 domain-containing protein [Mesorhizobium sp. M0306]|uniref:DUF982 domain-containing protein n=1 Tax=Mesorhizobium sp. M0306 TaxID=2956932 RepID=UPI00333A13D5
MPAFIPITIYLNCKPMVVASISDAAKALEQPWPYVAKPRRLEAVRMIKECLAGHCNQQAATMPSRRPQSNRDFLRKGLRA